jgi:photosystem II stability/assembly factor-like uncharacterized protein
MRMRSILIGLCAKANPFHRDSRVVAFAAAVTLVGLPGSAALGWHPDERSVSSLAVDGSRRGIVYAGTGSGVFKTVDGGATWSNASKGLADRHALDLTIDPRNSAVAYAGTAGGLFKSTDGGASWEHRGLARHDVVALAIHPWDSEILYAGTMCAVFKSSDGGRAWRRSLRIPNGRWALALAIDSRQPAIVYAGTGSGVFKSTDGGRHWRAANRGLASPSGRDRIEGFVRALAIDPRHPKTIYAGTERGFFKSTDAGASWTAPDTASTPRTVTSLAVDPRNSQVLYAGTYNGVAKSTEGGRSWRYRNRGLARRYVLEEPLVAAVAVDPHEPQTVYAGGTAWAGGTGGIFRSVDGAHRWRLASPFTLPKPHVISRYCSARGGLCLRIVEVERVVYFELATATHSLEEYLLCVRRVPPSGGGDSREFCVTYSVGKRLGGWGSLVRHTEQFRQLGTGTYVVTWKVDAGTPLGPVLRFKLPLR